MNYFLRINSSNAKVNTHTVKLRKLNHGRKTEAQRNAPEVIGYINGVTKDPCTTLSEVISVGLQIDTSINCVAQVAYCRITLSDESLLNNFINCFKCNMSKDSLRIMPRQMTFYIPARDMQSISALLYSYFTGNWFSNGDLLFLKLAFSVELSLKMEAVLSLRAGRELFISILLDIAAACYVAAIVNNEDIDGFRRKVSRITQEAAYNTATLGIESAVQAVGSAVAGTAISGVVDVAFSSASIYLAKRRRDKGELSEKEFNIKVKKTVFESSLKFVGGTTGSIIGQALIPVPIVGAVVGGFCGSLIGSGIGKGINYSIFKSDALTSRDDGNTKENRIVEHQNLYEIFHKKKKEIYVPMIVVYNEGKNRFEEKKFERNKKNEKNEMKIKTCASEKENAVVKPFLKKWVSKTTTKENECKEPTKKEIFCSEPLENSAMNQLPSCFENSQDTKPIYNSKNNNTSIKNFNRKKRITRNKSEDDSFNSTFYTSEDNIKSEISNQIQINRKDKQKRRSNTLEDINTTSVLKERSFLQTSIGNVKERWYSFNSKLFEESNTEVIAKETLLSELIQSEQPHENSKKASNGSYLNNQTENYKSVIKSNKDEKGDQKLRNTPESIFLKDISNNHNLRKIYDDNQENCAYYSETQNYIYLTKDCEKTVVFNQEPVKVSIRPEEFKKRSLFRKNDEKDIKTSFSTLFSFNQKQKQGVEENNKEKQGFKSLEGNKTEKSTVLKPADLNSECSEGNLSQNNDRFDWLNCKLKNGKTLTKLKKTKRESEELIFPSSYEEFTQTSVSEINCSPAERLITNGTSENIQDVETLETNQSSRVKSNALIKFRCGSQLKKIVSMDVFKRSIATKTSDANIEKNSLK